MEVYGAAFSPYCGRVLMAARYKGMKLEMAPTPGGGYKSAEYLKLNPFGKVPGLKDGKFFLYESSVIVEYLDAKSKKKALVPKAAKAAAQARLLAAVVGEYVQGAMGKLFAHMGPDRNQAAVDAILVEFNKNLDIYEGMISAKPFAAGAKFTIADVYAVPTLGLATLFLPAFFGVKDVLGGRKKLIKYMAKARKDKVMASVLKDQEDAFNAWRASKA